MTTVLNLFGAPTAEHRGSASPLRFERRAQLAVYLALKRNWVARTELAALLWPDLDSRLALANLRKALFRLQPLPWADRVQANADALRFDAETDVRAFEAALSEGRAAEALRLRRGELLEGFDEPGNEPWTAWLGFERNRLRVAWRGAAQSLLAGGIDPAAGAELAARLLDDDPFDEEALRAYVDCLARSGQAARARQAYREFAGRLERELGLAPGAQLRALNESLASPRPSDIGAAPAALDEGFVGRTVELRRIASLMTQDDCRLLTIFGPGGVGKTRLAQQALRDCAAMFDDGATFVALEDVASAGEIGGRLAHGLGVALKGRGDPIDQVFEALRPQRALLVLDNFEHLVDGAPLLERLLAGCPRLKILVTSRTRLALAAEWLLPLEGLPCPEEEDADHIESFDAVRVFLRAARRVSPDLAAGAEAAAIVDICRLVAGLPLALELAASWTRVLSCEAIADELRRGTALLHQAEGGRPLRQAGIEAVFERSWRLLTDIERDVLARLAVFHGSFSAPAARLVARAPLPVLGALADKSLLHRDGARLRLHPLVQQLVAERLREGPGGAQTHAAHAAYFHSLLAQQERAAEDGERKALESIDAEFDNCRQAWRFSVEAGQAEPLRRSAPTLLSYVEHRARFFDGLELFRQAAESPLAGSDAALRALMLGEASMLEFRLGRYADAEASARRALAGLRPKGDGETRYRALSVLAGCAAFTGRLDEARTLYEQALSVARSSGKAHDVAATLENLSLVEKRQGNYDEGLRLSLEALVQHRRSGDHAATALCLSNLGSFYMFLNRSDAAAVHLRDALALSETHGLVSTRAYVLANLTELALKARDAAAARQHAEGALQIAEGAGMRPLAGWLRLQLARLAAWRADLDAAAAQLAGGAELALSLDAPALKAAALLALAETCEALGEDGCARRILAFGIDQPSLSAPDRDELRAELDRRAGRNGADAGWPELTLDELLRRVVAEGGAAFAPLIADLRRGG